MKRRWLGVVVLGMVACGGGTGNEVPDGASIAIASFGATRSWGDTPVETDLAWVLAGTDGKGVTCSVDVDGDGSTDSRFAPCPVEGRVGHTYATWGKFEPTLTVTREGSEPLIAHAVVYSNHLIPADATVFPEQLGELVDVELGADSVRLVYAQPSVTIPVGAIVWGTSRGGFVRRVAAVDVQGATLTLATTPATMEDAFADGFFGMHDAPLQLESAGCTADCPVGTAVRVNAANAGKAAFEQSVTFTWGALRFPSDANVQATFGGVELEVALRATIEIGIIPRRFHMVVTPSLNARASASLEAGVAARRRLGSYTLGVVPIGPLAFTIKFEPELGVSAQVGASVSVDLTASMSATGELRWDASQSTAHLTGAATGTLTRSVGADAGFELETSLTAPFSFKLMGGLGPYIGPELRLTGNYDALTRCLDTIVVLGGVLGAELELWSIDITIAQIAATLYDHPLPRICWPPPSVDAGVRDASVPTDAPPPSADASMGDAPLADAPVVDATPTDASPADAPVADATPTDASPADAPPADAPPADALPPDGPAAAPTVLAMGLNGLHQLTTDATYVYWVENSLAFDGLLKRVAKAGGVVSTLATGLAQPNAVIVDGSYAYVIERNGGAMGSGRIVRVPLAGGGPELVTGGLSNAGTFLVQDSAYLYFGDFASIKRVAKSAGATATILVQGNGLLSVNPAIDIDGSYVYFRNDNRRLMRAPIAGGSVTDMGQVDAAAIRVIGGTLYFVDMANGWIGSMPAAGGTITTHVSGLVSPGNLVVDGGYIYWIEWSNPGAVKRVSTSGGLAETYSSVGNTFGIATDTANVYWATETLTGQGRIMRAPK